MRWTWGELWRRWSVAEISLNASDSHLVTLDHLIRNE